MSIAQYRLRVPWGLWGVLVWLLLPGPSSSETIEAIINPKAAQNTWVNDMAAVIDEDTERRLNALLDQLEQQTSAEIAVVTIRRTDGRPPKEFATALFKHWGIGKRDKDNGVLVLLVLEVRRIEVETGYGVEGDLPDGKVGEILDRRVIPRFKQGDFGAGLLAGVQGMVEVLTAAASPSGRVQSARDTPASQPLRTITSPFVFVPLLCVTGLLLFLIGMAVQRAGRRYCPQCQRLMRRLQEGQDDAYLSEAQQYEEELGSVDYHVWRCDDCQLCTMERALRSSRYEDCPECGHRTVYEELHIVHEPTYVQNGIREMRRVCRSSACSYRHSQRYKIPPREVVSSGGGWSASGGGWSSGGGGRSSSGGGSFGGGSSGGGGAGRSW